MLLLIYFINKRFLAYFDENDPFNPSMLRLGMIKKLLLVDYENKQKVDLSSLDESFKAIIFVGANQNAPKSSSNPATVRRFTRVDFLKISGNGKNALDFHIAFELGRTFQTAPETECFVLSGDKGFDPLMNHLKNNGMDCRRIESIDDLGLGKDTIAVEAVVCARCKKSSTIEHHGGHWCLNCGRFASHPDPRLLPSNQERYRQSKYEGEQPFVSLMQKELVSSNLPECGWCNQRMEMGDGIYDDGEWMCGNCISHHAR
jgi:hypothetical protein